MIICPDCKTENINNSQCCIKCGKELEPEVKTEDMKREEIARLIAAGKEAASNNEFKQAASLYRQAAELGDPEAQYSLGLLYMEGHGLEKNEKTAVSWIQKAAEQGHNDAQRKLAWCYLYGRGVKQSLSQSVKLSQMAAGTGAKVDMNKFGLLVRK